MHRFVVPIALLVSLAAAPIARGQVYMRQRPAAVAASYAAASQFAPYGHGGYGWPGGGFHQGGYASAFAGSWYARPYPYHFDYYRYRWTPPAMAPDCQCDVEPTATPRIVAPE